MKLKEIVTFTGKIICISGLCIGGSSNSLEIGGIDREVIKNPITKEPYIPGSSIKGKMRSELEKRYGALKRDRDKSLISTEKEPCGCGRKSCLICKIFGAHKYPGAPSAPTRIIVRDAVLSKEDNDLPIVLERKTENIIHRNSDTADAPRTIERVPGGTVFDFSIVLRIFEDDDKDELINKVEEGLELLKKSYLGGCGSRGYGHIDIKYTVTSDKGQESV